MFDIVKTQEILAGAYGPAGCEGCVAEVIAELAKPYADEVYTDTLGNLIAVKRAGDPSVPKVMFSAHMDSIGLIVTHIDEKGFLWVSNLGCIHLRAVSGTAVKFQNGTRGVVFTGGKADPKEPKISDLYIDIGAKDGVSARKTVSVGDTAVFDQPVFTMGDGLLASPYLDNRIACVALLAVMEDLPKVKNDLYFVFSVQEEVGLRGAKTAAYAIDPDYGFAVDVTSSGDTPDYTPKMEVKLCGGAGVKVMDTSVICHPKVVKWLEDTAAREGIAWQREILQRGGTDAGAIHVTRTGVYTGAISVPTRYIHNTLEICALEDVEAVIKLVRAACGISL
jgi:endoglucanase